ncbi:hypothetical protein D3C72_1772650 [compost metagenome]
MVSLLRKAQHGFGKVAAARRIHPAGTEDKVLGTALGNRLLAFQLGLAIDRQRAGGIALLPRRGTAAVKYIVGAVVHQPSAQGLGLARQHAHRFGIDSAGGVHVALRLVDGGIGRSIHDDVGLNHPHGFGQRIRLQQIATQRAAVAIERDQLAQGLQAALQLPTDLAVLAEQQNLHSTTFRRR